MAGFLSALTALIRREARCACGLALTPCWRYASELLDFFAEKLLHRGAWALERHTEQRLDRPCTDNLGALGVAHTGIICDANCAEVGQRDVGGNGQTAVLQPLALLAT